MSFGSAKRPKLQSLISTAARTTAVIAARAGRCGQGCTARRSVRSCETGALAMTTAALAPRTHPFDVDDIEYLRHGDKPLLARVFRPRGEGPFPALVECHGGAW